MMGWRVRLTGAERDIVSRRWRRWLCYAKRGSGPVKRALRKRTRRAERVAVVREAREGIA